MIANMCEYEPESHISEVETIWTDLNHICHPSQTCSGPARVRLVERYGLAIRRYLLTRARDPEVAEDLAQEFFLKLFRGDFRNAAPCRGRFRNYLRVALCNLVNEHHRRRQRDPIPLPEVGEEVVEAADLPGRSEQDREFQNNYLLGLINHAWAELRRFEDRGGPPLFSVLRHRNDHPEESGAESAAALSTPLGRGLSAKRIHQLVHQARRMFAGLILQGVIADLGGSPMPDVLEEELADLKILELTRDAFDDWRRRRCRD